MFKIGCTTRKILVLTVITCSQNRVGSKNIYLQLVYPALTWHLLCLQDIQQHIEEINFTICLNTSLGKASIMSTIIPFPLRSQAIMARLCHHPRQPIRAQQHGHVTCIHQSQASIPTTLKMTVGLSPWSQMSQTQVINIFQHFPTKDNPWSDRLQFPMKMTGIVLSSLQRKLNSFIPQVLSRHDWLHLLPAKILRSVQIIVRCQIIIVTKTLSPKGQ